MKNRNIPVMIGKNLKKGLIAGKPKKSILWHGRDLFIVWLKKRFESGEEFAISDIDKIDTHIHFCDKDSLERMIDVLTKMRDEWEGEQDER